MRTAKYFIYSFIALLFIFLTGCSTTTDPAESYRGETAEQIFQGGEDALRDKNYAEATKRFEALDAQYPFDRNIETAHLHIIYAYYMNNDYASAEAAADRFIHLHPTSQHDDYAYYMRGLSNYYQNMGVFERLFAVDFATRDLTQVKKSYNDFATLQRRYPNSPYAPAAHQYLIYLRNVLANHQLEVGQYYFNRQAYVASANRASLVVEHYQGAPAVPNALVLMAKSYYQLHLGEQLNQTIEVIQYNYPNTRYAEEVSGRELGDTKFTVERMDAGSPVKAGPGAAAAPPNSGITVSTTAENVQHDANGGSRESTTLVGKLARSFDNWKASHVSSPESLAQQNGQQPVQQQQVQQAQQQQPVQQLPVQQTRAQQQAVAQPVQAQAQPQGQEQQHSQQGTVANNSAPGGTSLGDLWGKIKNSDFFSSHSKTTKTESPSQPTTQADASLAGAPPAAAPVTEQQAAVAQQQAAADQQVANGAYAAVGSDNGTRR